MEIINKQIYAIDLCCGIGGMTNGLISAGIKVIAGFDIDKSCRYAYEFNNNVPFYNDDLMKTSSKKIAGLFPSYAEKTYIHMSPPCQPFSAMTKKGKRMSDHSKYNIADRLFDILLEIKPFFISIEEVPRVIKSDNFVLRVKELEQFYDIDQKIINIANWGAPQNRKRYFLIGHLNPLKSFLNKYTEKTWNNPYD